MFLGGSPWAELPWRSPQPSPKSPFNPKLQPLAPALPDCPSGRARTALAKSVRSSAQRPRRRAPHPSSRPPPSALWPSAAPRLRQAASARPLAPGPFAASPSPAGQGCCGAPRAAYCLLQHTTAHGKINVYLFRKLLWE